MRDRHKSGNYENSITDLHAVLAIVTDGSLRQTADLLDCSYAQVSLIRSGERRAYIKAFCDSKLPNVKIPLKYAQRLKWLFDDIIECGKDISAV